MLHLRFNGVPTTQRQTPLRRFIRWLVVLGFAALSGILLLIGLLWLDHRRETTLPPPSGAFAIGRTLQAWKIAPRDSTDPESGTHRTLLAWIWYPARSPQQSQQTSRYLPEPWRRAVEHHAGVLLSKVLTRDLSRVRTHSVDDAEVSPQERMYPVVLLRAGLAAQTATYTSLAEDLASHGYVVVGFDAPYRTIVSVLPDGTVIERTPENDADRFSGLQQEQVATRLVREWSADMNSAVDQLERLNASDSTSRFYRRLDMQRIGVMGHSLGGATALEFCHEDARCKAGIDIDGAPLGSVIAEGVGKPFMFLLCDHSGEPDAPEVQARIDTIYNRLPAGQRVMLTIKGANHFGFSDDGAFLKSPLARKLLRAVGVLKLDGSRQIAITTQSVDAFLDVYLKHVSARKPGQNQTFPELVTRQ